MISRSFVASLTMILLLAGSAEAQMLPHPAGCPARLFCGCGAAVRVFGEPRRDLWAAASWKRFPRALSPHPGAACVQPGHVAILEQPVAGDRWLAYDANSGRGATQIHEISIRRCSVITSPR